MKQTLNGPGGMRLEIDTDNPDTPAMIYVGKHSATFYCALETGEIDCGDGPDVTREQFKWMLSHEKQVDQAFDTARAGMPQYGNAPLHEMHEDSPSLEDTAPNEHFTERG